MSLVKHRTLAVSVVQISEASVSWRFLVLWQFQSVPWCLSTFRMLAASGRVRYGRFHCTSVSTEKSEIGLVTRSVSLFMRSWPSIFLFHIHIEKFPNAEFQLYIHHVFKFLQTFRIRQLLVNTLVGRYPSFMIIIAGSVD